MKNLTLLTIFLFVLITSIRGDDGWDKALKTYCADNKISFLTQFRYYTYLYVAQNEAWPCDEKVLNCIAVELSQRFFPHFAFKTHCDGASLRLAKKIVTPYLERLDREDLRPPSFDPCWPEINQAITGQIAQWIPWNPPLPTIRPPFAINDHLAWGRQFEELRLIQSQLNDYELAAVYIRASGQGCCSYQDVNAFMSERHVPKKTVLLVRSVLMQALYDGIIAENEIKYTYCIPRPGQMDPTFRPVITSDTPSYPSGHAIQGAITATILSHFFPEFSRYWQEQATEASNSRLWAGLHFPEDVEQGEILGKSIAQQALDTLALQPTPKL